MRSSMQWHTRTPRAAVLSTPHPLRLPPLPALLFLKNNGFDGQDGWRVEVRRDTGRAPGGESGSGETVYYEFRVFAKISG